LTLIPEMPPQGKREALGQIEHEGNPFAPTSKM
jgi:hypothetical protein